MKPYECKPTPSMLTPNHDRLVMILPNTAKTATPRSRAYPPHRACKIIAFQITMRSAPFSFGSQPQKRPQDGSPQIPPRMVPTKLNKVAKQTIPYIIRPSDLAVVSLKDFVSRPRKM